VFLKFDGPMANDKFISIITMSYFRPEMTLDLLKSIHAKADMPFEIILHDDHSDDWVQDKIYSEIRGLCSTVILGQGNVNMGYSSSANRGIALCNSDYVLLIDNDCVITRPCFQMIKDVLDVPYVGSMSPREIIGGDIEKRRPVVKFKNRSFSLSNLPCGSFAFKKAVWQEVGGFPQVYSNGGDISFLHTLLQRGYFNAGNVISSTGESFTTIRNIDQETGYPNATSGIRNFDQAYPRIFPYCHDVRTFHNECHIRRSRRHSFSHEQYLAEAGIHNIAYWDKWMNDCYAGIGSINWDNIGDFGHIKWRDRIEADIKTWKERV
jgi:glycosyltransferase involved in cell wall biosynthesis